MVNRTRPGSQRRQLPCFASASWEKPHPLLDMAAAAAGCLRQHCAGLDRPLPDPLRACNGSAGCPLLLMLGADGFFAVWNPRKGQSSCQRQAWKLSACLGQGHHELGCQGRACLFWHLRAAASHCHLSASDWGEAPAPPVLSCQCRRALTHADAGEVAPGVHASRAPGTCHWLGMGTSPPACPRCLKRHLPAAACGFAGPGAAPPEPAASPCTSAQPAALC